MRKINPGRIASTKIVILDSTDIQEAAPTQNYLFAACAIALQIPAASIASASQMKVPKNGYTAVKVGVPNLETDLFTNVNKLCPSCNT